MKDAHFFPPQLDILLELCGGKLAPARGGKPLPLPVPLDSKPLVGKLLVGGKLLSEAPELTGRQLALAYLGPRLHG